MTENEDHSPDTIEQALVWLVHDAEFLADRVDDLERSLSDFGIDDYEGQVIPALARLRQSLAAAMKFVSDGE